MRFILKHRIERTMEKDLIEILNNHQGLIYKVCNLYCSDREDRKDLFQEIVLQVWKSLGSFRHESSLSTWMYRIALNTAITHLKKEKKTLNQQLSLNGIEIPELNDSDEKEEQLNALFIAIEHLDKIDKSIILLYLEEKSYEEISEITGLSKSNVGVKLNRIKTKLSNTLKK
jgi:RNA polymerase sigma factor (sigma-70 family)